MTILSSLQHLGLKYETTFGTAAVPPTVYLPVNSVKPEDVIKKISDEGRRANLTKTFAVYDGVTNSTVDIELDCYTDTIGYLLKAILGQDTVSGTGPYTHVFKVVNSLAPSLTLSYYNGIAEHAYAGSIMSDLSLKFDTENVVTASAKFLGMKGASTTTTTASYSTVAPLMGWGAALSIGGSGNLNMVGGEISIKREAKLLYGANNTQAPSKQSTGRIEMTGKLTFDVESEAELSLLGNGATAIALTLNQSANASMIISCASCDIAKVAIDTTQEFVRVDLDFTALYNATDAGMTTITLKNAVATY